MLTQEAIGKRKIIIFSQFSYNGKDLIDYNYSPDKYPFVWVANALHSDGDIQEIILGKAAEFGPHQLHGVNLSRLFSNEYSVLIFFDKIFIFEQFIDRLYDDTMVYLRSENSMEIVPYRKANLLNSAKRLINGTYIPNDSLVI